jgi:hypothetical protein
MQIANHRFHWRALHVRQTRITALLYPFPIIVLSTKHHSCQRRSHPFASRASALLSLTMLISLRMAFHRRMALVVFITGWLRTSQRVRCLSAVLPSRRGVPFWR